MKWYRYEIHYLDRGRYSRSVEGLIKGSNLGTAAQRAVNDAKGKAKGWPREAGETQIDIRLTVSGPVTK